MDPLNFVLEKFCSYNVMKIFDGNCVSKESVVVLCSVGVPTLKLIQVARTKVFLLAGIAG